MKNFVIFLVGAVVGGVTGWLLTKRKYETYVKCTLEEISDEGPKIKIAHDKDVENASIGEMEKYISDMLSDIFDGRDEEAIHFLADQLEKFGATVTDAYGENADQYYEDVNPVEEDEEDDENPSDSDENDSIYQIDDKEFREGNPNFSKEQIDYYDGDSTFVDLESGEIVDKWKQYFGNDILNWIEDHNWRKGSLYVRNMALSSDYQIVFKETSYAAASGESENEEDYNAGDFADKRRR